MLYKNWVQLTPEQEKLQEQEKMQSWSYQKWVTTQITSPLVVQTKQEPIKKVWIVTKLTPLIATTSPLVAQTKQAPVISSGVNAPQKVTSQTAINPNIANQKIKTTETTDFSKWVQEWKYAQSSNWEYIDSKTWQIVWKVWVWDTVWISSVVWTPTTFDDQTNRILNETYTYTWDDWKQKNIQFKDIYEALTPEQKKYYNDLWKAWSEAFKKWLEWAFRDVRDVKSTIEYNQLQRDKNKQIEQLWTEYQNIQVEEENKRAFNELQRLKQNIWFLSYWLWQPWKSQERLESLQNQIKEQETTYRNIIKLNENIKKQRALWLEINEASYQKQLKDLNQTLVDWVDKVIQWAINSFNSYEIQWILDDPQKFTEISRQILSSMDADISWLSDTAFKQKQFVLQSFNDLVTQKQEYLQNVWVVDKDRSLEFYIDKNNNPILNEYWQKILIPQEWKKPIFTEMKDWKFVAIYENNDWTLDTVIQDIFSPEKMDDNIINWYVNAIQNEDLSLEWFLKSGIDKDIVNKVIAKYGALGWTLWGWNSSQWQWFSWDISMNQTLINKYPNEAAFKNNNPTWMTWWISEELKWMLDKAWIKYNIGTARPEAEWWNYIKFASVDDGMKAYQIMLTQRWDDINSRLQKWVWTSEWPTYAANLMQKAWIPMWTKFSELNETQLLDLMSYQLQKESPNFYKEVILWWASTQWTQTEISYTALQEKMLKDFDWKDIWKLADNLWVNEKQARYLYNNFLTQNQWSTDDEMNNKALWLIQWLWGTEWERAQFVNNLVKTSKKYNITLQEAKKKLWYKTWDDVEFAKIRKDDIQTRKNDTLWVAEKARMTLNILNNKDTAIWDVVATVWFLKTIDPASVARESEVASVENARWIYDTIYNIANKAKTWQKLTEVQREEIKQAMKTIVIAAEKNYYWFLNDTKTEFNERWLDYNVYIWKTDNEKAKEYEIVYSDWWKDFTMEEIQNDLQNDLKNWLVTEEEIRQFMIENKFYKYIKK